VERRFLPRKSFLVETHSLKMGGSGLVRVVTMRHNVYGGLPSLLFIVLSIRLGIIEILKLSV
jgi:hypothetical protein